MKKKRLFVSESWGEGEVGAPLRPPDRLGRLGGAGLLEVGVSEEGPSGGEGVPQAAMRGRHWGNSAEGLGGGGKRPFVSAAVGSWRGGQTIEHGEREREKEMQRKTDAASHQKTLGGSSYANPTCQGWVTRRLGGGEGLHFLDNSATCSQRPHLPPTMWTPQT